MSENLELLKHQYYHIYVSYHNKQKIEVERFCNRFKETGFRIWFDINHIAPGVNLFDDSLVALTHSFIFVCFLSNEYKNSLKCRVEFSTAIEQKMSVYSFIFDDFDYKTDDLFNNLQDNLSVRLFIETSLIQDLKCEKFNSILESIREVVKNEENNKKSYQLKVKSYYDTI